MTILILSRVLAVGPNVGQEEEIVVPYNLVRDLVSSFFACFFPDSYQVLNPILEHFVYFQDGMKRKEKLAGFPGFQRKTPKPFESNKNFFFQKYVEKGIQPRVSAKNRVQNEGPTKGREIQIRGRYRRLISDESLDYTTNYRLVRNFGRRPSDGTFST